jgi:hypothetical protein
MKRKTIRICFAEAENNFIPLQRIYSGLIGFDSG